MPTRSTPICRPGGKVAGGYHSFTGDLPDTGRVVVVEGYATGAAIHEATGLHVVVAFNAGNLLPVAKRLHEINPELRIIIAADNDRFAKCKADGCGQRVPVAVATCPHCKQPHGQINTGAEKARKAANIVGGIVVSPAFADNEAGSDWNDWERRHGMEALKEAITKQIRAAERPRRPTHPLQAEAQAAGCRYSLAPHLWIVGGDTIKTVSP